MAKRRMRTAVRSRAILYRRESRAQAVNIRLSAERAWRSTVKKKVCLYRQSKTGENQCGGDRIYPLGAIRAQ